MNWAVVGLLLLAVFGGLFFLAHYNIWRPRVDEKLVRVLMYHSISDADTELAVKPARFERQLNWLASRGYLFCTVSEVLAEPVSEQKRVVLTFDDGFADNYSTMWPLLTRYNAKATIYLAPDIKGIEKLTPEQIREMAASGLCEFGAHTLHHVNLSTLTAAEAQAEITGSKVWVENCLKQPCRAFAYPFGRFNDETVAQVKAAGFESAVTVKKGIEPLTDPFRIKRISILGKTDMLQFAIAISRGRYRV